MSSGIDVFRLFPELAAIGRQQLQIYCNEWLRRPVAREWGVDVISVDADLALSINVHPTHAERAGDRLFIPIDQLLQYIVERHFADPMERRQWYERIRDTRQRWAELGRDYGASVGRRGKLYLTCKNCRAELETGQEGVEGWSVTCPSTELTCPVCGVAETYEGHDLHLGPRT